MYYITLKVSPTGGAISLKYTPKSDKTIYPYWTASYNSPKLWGVSLQLVNVHDPEFKIVEENDVPIKMLDLEKAVEYATTYLDKYLAKERSKV